MSDRSGYNPSSNGLNSSARRKNRARSNAFVRFLKYPLTLGEPVSDKEGHRHIKVDPKDYKLNLLLFRRIWRVAKPYWTRRGAWVSWVTYAFLLATVVVSTAIWAYSTELLKDLTNSIIDKRQEDFRTLLVTYALYLVAVFVFFRAVSLTSNVFRLHWRKWLTRYLVDRFLDRRTYYDIGLKEDLDNPDQRIQEEVEPFVSMIAMLPDRLFRHVLYIAAGGMIVVTIAPSILVFVIIYSIVYSIVNYFLYVPTIKQQYDHTVAEADLRYGILHVRDNAESVAFYNGEYAESEQIDSRLLMAVKRQAKIFYYDVFVSVVNRAFTISWELFPYILLVPLFFAGEFEYGAIAQATAAATTMSNALRQLLIFVPMIAAAAPKAVRLCHIIERFDELDSGHSDPDIPRIDVVQGDRIKLENVTMETPGGEILLVRDLSLELANGERVVIVGQTGTGKSSLLRAMAGLWRRGSGTLTMPPSEQMLFLPQRPYMILGTLRDQLLYPHGDELKVEDNTLREALERAALPDLLDKHGGLDSSRDWGKVLSLGEQQRIGFARILIAKPEFVFLDEATSAVDPETEATLYKLLVETGATIVSVAHRPAAWGFHDKMLSMIPDGSWNLEAIQNGVQLP